MTPKPAALEEIRRELERQERQLAAIDQLARARADVQLHITEEFETQMTAISQSLVRTRSLPPTTFAVRV